MKIYYLNDKSYSYSEEERSVLDYYAQKESKPPKPIHINKCSKSRFLCRKERLQKLNKDLGKISDKAVILFFNWMHLGKSFAEIKKLVNSHKKAFWYIIFDELNCPEKYLYEKEHDFIICRISHMTFNLSKSLNQKFFKQQGILHGIKNTKKKMKGRKKGTTNKQSDYDPYREKILEGLKKGWSQSAILRYIGFGTKSGLRYYINKRILSF